MKKLLLFDIDGTLITGGKDNLFAQALKKTHNLDAVPGFDHRGMTDYTILGAFLEELGWSKKEAADAMPGLLKGLDSVHSEVFNMHDYSVLPGVKELLIRLCDLGCTLGLITGNLETRARRKLEALGLWKYFSVGGFGSDPHQVRADLVKVAIRRAGFEESLKDVFVLGDTVKDIEAAHEAGVKSSVGVANGFRDPEELANAGAKYIFDDFMNTDEVIKKLGLERT